MVVHNSTFMILREREGEFMLWLKGVLAGMAGLVNPRVSAMREAGGVDYRLADTHSVAMQSEFDDIESARRWSREEFASVAARFEEEFGPEGMVFVSLFEVVEGIVD